MGVAKGMTRVSAIIPESLIREAAFNQGLPGNSGKSMVGRYAIALLATGDHTAARHRATIQRKATPLKALATPTAIDVPADVLAEAWDAIPDNSPVHKSQAALIRYALARSNGFGEEDSVSLAIARPAKLREGIAV
jgi:hypothetical protein